MIIKWYNRDAISDQDMRQAKKVADKLRGINPSTTIVFPPMGEYPCSFIENWEPQMSTIVMSIHKEMNRRNPIGINYYANYVEVAAAALLEISGGEADNFTSECGPKEREVETN